MSIIIALLAFMQARVFIRKSDAAWDAGDKLAAWRWLALGLGAVTVETIALVWL